jgi:cation diffusion facilitator family transporter
MVEQTSEAQARAKRRVTWLGAAVNLPLALGKIVVGVWGQSAALVADGVHSLADLASDLAVLWALGHSARAPDREHPYGHGRFETLVTLAISAALILTALGILLDAAVRLGGGGPATPPGAPVLVAALFSLVVKEALYRITLQVGRQTESALIVANAWHHRSDALSSVVAALGIGAAMAGWPGFDALAAALIALLLVRIGWLQALPAASELVDAQATEAERATLRAQLSGSPGVAGVRHLRLRRHGAALVADASLLVNPDLTVTEGHRIAEAARTEAIAAIPRLEQLVLHVEPEGHAEGYGAEAAPLRGEIEGRIRALLAEVAPGAAAQEVRLGYFAEGLTVEIVARLPEAARPDQADIERRMEARVRAVLPRLMRLRLHLAAPR